MSAKSRSGEETSAVRPEGVNSGEIDSPENDLAGETVIATARSMPRPGTILHSHPQGKVGKCKVSLLGDISSVPSVEEVERMNQGGEARTPVITVIQAVLAKAGGSMLVEELVPEVRKYWNHSFPASPYTPEEFIYIMAKNSDSMRAS
jgi:hypothetical protein